MKPDNFDDPGALAADARDNRRAIIVAASAAIVIAIASGVLMASAHHSPEQAVPHPLPSSAGSLGFTGTTTFLPE